MVSLRRIVRFLRLADRAMESGHGLSAAQLFCLRVLDGEPATSLAEVAARTMTDQSSVSTVVARLVERGYVSRKTGADRRRAELKLTAAGQRIIDGSPVAPQTKIVDAIRAMPAAHRKQLVQSLDRFVIAIGADALEPRMFFEDDAPAKRRRATP